MGDRRAGDVGRCRGKRGRTLLPTSAGSDGRSGRKHLGLGIGNVGYRAEEDTAVGIDGHLG